MNYYEVQFVKWKNVSTKNEWVITIWIETNEQLFEILRHSYWKVFHINIEYNWEKFKEFPCNINEDGANSTMWVKDHWLIKIDIIWWDVIPVLMLTGGNLFINI